MHRKPGKTEDTGAIRRDAPVSSVNSVISVVETNRATAATYPTRIDSPKSGVQSLGSLGRT